MKNQKSSKKTAKKGGLRGYGSKKKRRSRGMGAVGAIKNVAKDQLNPVGIFLGYAGGAFVGRMLDKIEAIRPDATIEKFQIKSLIKPAVLIGTGITISTIAGKKSGTGAMFFKNIGYGVTVSGGVALVKGVIKKDLFAGLGNAPAANAKYLAETKELLKKLIEENSEQILLPELSEEGTNGIGTNTVFTPTLQLDAMETIM